jgi:hypothetical protein
LVSPERNLIGFADNRGHYYLYAYSDDQFVMLADLELAYWRENTDGIYLVPCLARAVFAGDFLYVFSETGLDVYEINGFGLKKTVVITDGSPAGYSYMR